MTAIKSLNDKILWPVLPEYVEACNRAYPEINFIDYLWLGVDYNRKDRYFIQDAEVIPLRWQDVPIWDAMKNKYAYFGFDYRNWKRSAMWKRDITKEHQLIKMLNIENGEKFNLVNGKFGCHKPGQELKAGIHFMPFEIPNNGLRNINLDIIPGYSLFDWASIIERAENIFTVSTSVFYLLELLRLGAKEIHLYPRLPFERDFRNIEYLMTKKYVCHI